MRNKLLVAAAAASPSACRAGRQDMVPTPGPTPPPSGTPVPTPGWTPAPTRPPDGAPSLRKGLPKTPSSMEPELTPTPGGEPPPPPADAGSRIAPTPQALGDR